jgi:hypothetical protein
VRAGVVLAVVGVVLAGALGFAAHVVAQDTIGLPAVSLKGGRPLAPEDARPKKKEQQETTERSETTRTETTRTQTVDDHGGTTGQVEPGDDSGGHGRNRGSGGGSDD